MPVIIENTLYALYVCFVSCVLASNAYCLASSVSSRLLEAIAIAEGVNFEVRVLPSSSHMAVLNCLVAVPTLGFGNFKT